MWIIDLHFTHPSPHPIVLARPSTPKVLRAKERTPTFYLVVVFTFGLIVESMKEFGGALNNASELYVVRQFVFTEAKSKWHLDVGEDD